MAAFAANHMEKHGWTKGKGLGREENGMSEPIKVSIKADSTGVGHDASKQFTFHWWEHAFETASKNITVKEHEDGVVLSVSDTSITTSTKSVYKKSLTAKSMLYGRFIKSEVLNNGLVEKTEFADSSSDENDENEKHRPLTKDLKMLTDDDLLNACGGRTAHKGARHGLKQSGKLARLAEQETLTEKPKEDAPRKLKKKKRKLKNVNIPAGEEVESSPVQSKKNLGQKLETPVLDEDIPNAVNNCKKKKKKRKKRETNNLPVEIGDEFNENSTEPSKKRTKRKGAKNVSVKVK